MRNIRIAITLILILVIFASWRAIVELGQFSRTLVGLVSESHEQIVKLHVGNVLSQFAQDPAFQQLDPTACERMYDTLQSHNNLFTVLALGDAHGTALCTADPTYATSLPTMKDRLYYQRVVDSHDMVMGEYTVSKTTGKPVIHFAYPIYRNSTFVGFVLAGVDLKWFVNEVVDKQFRAQGLEILAVDQSGKLLFSYPSGGEVGGQMFDAQEASVLLSGRSVRYWRRGADGMPRIYVYEPQNGEIGKEIMYLVGFRVYPFMWPILVALALIIGSYIHMRRVVAKKR